MMIKLLLNVSTVTMFFKENAQNVQMLMLNYVNSECSNNVMMDITLMELNVLNVELEQELVNQILQL